MYDLLKRKTEGLRAGATEFAANLVRTPSVSLSEGRAADLIEKEMKKLGYEQVFRDESGNVVGVMTGRQAEPTLLLSSHMDTVPAGSLEDWGESPYTGRITDGRLYGLGAADCKAGLAAQVYAGALLKRSMLPLAGNLVVAATTAEENGLAIGLRGLMKKTLPDMELAPTWAILGEPTGLGLYYGHEGWVELEIRVEGANPFQVDDAARAVQKELAEGPSAGREVGGDEPSLVEAPRFENVAGVRRATLRLNRPVSAGQQVGQIVTHVHHSATLAAQASGPVAVEVAVRQDSQKMYTGHTSVVRHVTHAWLTDPFHPLMQRSWQSLAAAGCEVRPGKWQLGRPGMGTAGAVLTQEFDVPTVGYGPGDEADAHGARESVSVEHIAQALYGTAAIAHGLVGIPVCGWTADEI
jgi:acetylornithine deacetylase/succinyl-diaminopimelate desuccinylase-like protein